MRLGMKVPTLSEVTIIQASNATIKEMMESVIMMSSSCRVGLQSDIGSSGDGWEPDSTSLLVLCVPTRTTECLPFSSRLKTDTGAMAG